MKHDNLNLATFTRQLKMIYFAVTDTPVMLAIVLTLTFSQPEKNATDDMSLFIFGGVALFFSLTTLALSVFPPYEIKKPN